MPFYNLIIRDLKLAFFSSTNFLFAASFLILILILIPFVFGTNVCSFSILFTGFIWISIALSILLTLDGFDPKDGDGEDTFILCYWAVIEFNSDKFPKFIDALEYSSNQVEIKIGFKLSNGDDVDEEVCEGYSDIPVKLKTLVNDAG
mgnify:CR=1 FL=1